MSNKSVPVSLAISILKVVEGAQLDNNLMESQLKLAVRNPKNAMFHKRQMGATISDAIKSLIATSASALRTLRLLHMNWLKRRSFLELFSPPSSEKEKLNIKQVSFLCVMGQQYL